MNTVFLSPHFPPDFWHFCAGLKQAGATVLGLADAHYDSLENDLRASLTDYYRVSDMHNYDELVRALGYFTHHYGKLDRIDSHNEYWLETESRLRTDFNIPGIKLDQIDRVKRKSYMKRIFRQSGLNPAFGRLCDTPDDIRDLIAEIGYPVVAKPDIGVGAAQTYKLENDVDLARFLNRKPPEQFIVEQFIDSPIVTFDGLVDKDGLPVFTSSLRYSKGVMEAVVDDSDLYYYIVREIEPTLESAGLATMRGFDVRERFFHFEYFLTDEGEPIPMEVNIRPPGGLTPMMFNYVWDFDCYQCWADMVVKGISTEVGPRRYFVMYVGRKDHIPYALTHEQVLEQHRSLIVQHEPISGVFARAIGNYGYILRHADLNPLLAASAHLIQKRVS